jgi:hypothetical protein
MWPSLVDLRGIRRPLLNLAILFFTIMLLEIDLGHRPALATHDAWLALLPVVWLPIALLVLMAVQLVPSTFTVIAAQIVTAISVVVGMLGCGLHMMVSGVDLEHLDRVFSSAVWGGPASPNWPAGVAVAALLGFIGTFGVSRAGESLTYDIGGTAAAAAYVLIVVGVGFAAVPSMVMVAASSLALGALLLLAALIGMMASKTPERSVP